MNNALVTDLTRLEKAIVQLQKMLGLPVDHEGRREAVIQCFEFVVELSWKALKHFLKKVEEIEANSPKSVFREAFSIGWIDDEELWVSMLKDRNLSSHTYNEDLANEILGRIPTYMPMIEKAFTELKRMAEND
ncbi:MAG TPA: HI0074 family nucleotidyltransferase substrate-binding subunit [Alphaproteobacteria bacterium]|nr:nucleotidyltransferase substrate binding protein [Alphaproteobacteria bacterium]HOO51781.1 HI0074 family nucleotidyltransferase substrate-binding subunit [Alphaproteobacteria bacterium]